MRAGMRNKEFCLRGLIGHMQCVCVGGGGAELSPITILFCIVFSVRYSVVLSCWKTDPDMRPIFRELTSTLISRLVSRGATIFC